MFLLADLEVRQLALGAGRIARTGRALEEEGDA
jgi:hypothetical protein